MTDTTFAPIAANFLHIRVSTSKGRDTYGYTIVTATDNATDKAYRTCGGGYDMRGTVVADWLESVAQDRLLALAALCGRDDSRTYGTDNKWAPIKGYYGSTINPDGSISLDGGCGIESIRHIAEAVGIVIRGCYGTGRKRDSLIGYFVTDSGMPAELPSNIAAHSA